MELFTWYFTRIRFLECVSSKSFRNRGLVLEKHYYTKSIFERGGITVGDRFEVGFMEDRAALGPQARKFNQEVLTKNFFFI